uniref:STAS domain-containing protein n=1 Tax=Bursaphelenchus xylophilus TaxID=6326 RepID=A0A1I7RK18_BURXY
MDQNVEFVNLEAKRKNLLQKTVNNYKRPFRTKNVFFKSLVGFCPSIQWLPNYNLQKLYQDLAGGLTVGIMNIPQGIAYAILAEIPPVNGLYTVLLACLIFPFLSSWPHGSLGPFAVVELMCGALVRRLMADDTLDFETTPTEIISTLTFLTGLFHIFLASLRVTFITEYFSGALVGGFVTGAAIHVLISQFDSFLGIMKIRSSGLLYLFKNVIAICSQIPNTNLMTLGIGVVSVAFLLIGKMIVTPALNASLKKKLTIPYELILCIVATIISYFFDFNGRFNVKIVGDIPQGIPMPAMPNAALLQYIWTDALAITVVMVAVHLSIATVMCQKKGYVVDDNQEIYAVGATLAVSGLFPTFPAANGLGRPLILSECGAVTQMANLIAFAFTFVVVMFFASFFYCLPMTVLAAIILVALRNILKGFKELPSFYRISRYDFVLWCVAFGATVLTDVIGGLIISLCFQLLIVTWRTQWPKWEACYSKRKHKMDMCIYRFEAMLIFSNARLFKKTVEETLRKWNAQGLGPVPRVFIFDFSGVTHIDTAGLKALQEMVEAIKRAAASVNFVEATEQVQRQIQLTHPILEECGFYDSAEELIFDSSCKPNEQPITILSTNPFDFQLHESRI